MNTTSKIMWFLTIFFVIVAGAYAFSTHTWDEHGIEPAGVVAILVTGFMCAMIAFYFQMTHKRLPGLPPEDNALGESTEAEGEYGFFSPYSWMPILAAGCASLTVMGLFIGWWMFVIMVCISLFAVVGWVFEYFHGDHAV